MAATNDANYQEIEVTLVWTDTPGCSRPGWSEWLRSINPRVTLPRTTTVSGAAFASELPNNQTRIDPSGGIFTAAIKRYTIPSIDEQLSAEDGPGTEKIINIPMANSGISDLANALTSDIKVFISPLEAAVAQSPVTVNGTNLQIRFSRMKTGLTAPYDPVTISIRGTVYELPQPEPAA